MNRTSPTRGFTMLELAIVLVIISVVMTMGMISYQQVMETTHRTATENKMDVIERALADFKQRYGRLPCPANRSIGNGDAGYGTEYVSGDDCAAPVNSVRGMVPVKALGLPDEFMLDGWGRRFTYQVDVRAHSPYMSEVPLDAPADSNALTINGASAAVKSTNALYVLISHGSNGYGAYDSSGTAISTTGADADELTNASYSLTTVQKDLVEGDAGTFDDIVRFKERWQMQSEEEQKAFKSNAPQLVVGGTNGAGTLWLAGFKKGQGGMWAHSSNIWGSTLDAMTAGASVSGSNLRTLLFTPDNERLFVYSDSSPNCRLMRISGSTFTDIPGTPIPAAACPGSYSNSNIAAMSDNGYLAIVDSSSGAVRLSRQAGDVFTSLGTLSPAFGSTATSISFSHDAELMLLANSTTTIKLYSRKPDGSGFNLVSAAPSGFSGSIVSAAISPSGRYIALTNNDSPQKLYLWRVDGRYSVTALTGSPTNSPITTSSVTSMRMAFSPDSRYLAIGSDGSSDKMPVVYKIDEGDVVSDVDTYESPGGFAADQIAFDSSARNMAIIYNQASGALLTTLQRKEATQFVFSSTASTNRPKAIAFSR